MVDYASPWESIPRDSLHAAHDMPLSQVRNSASALAALLDENKDEQVLKEACLGLCQLFGEGIQNDRIQAILEANVVPKLVALLRPSKSRFVPQAVQSAALQVLGNVACGDDRQTQVVIDSDALPCLRALLSSGDRNIRKEVCWIVSNITESSHQVQDVLDADILPPLLKLLDSQDSACREDATWVLFNLSSNKDPTQIAYLAEKNGVRALCNLLSCSKELDVLWKGCGTVAAVALKGLRNILISGQKLAASDPNGYNRMASLVAEAHGVERIEALTTHVSLEVRRRARLLLERIFGAEPSTADLSPPLPPPSVTALPTLSPPPPPTLGPSQCSCACQQQHHHHQTHPPHQFQPSTMYDVSANLTAHAALPPSPHLNHGLTVDHAMPGHLHPEGDLIDVPGSSSGSSTDSDPEDDDSDSDLIPPPPAPCTCVLCSDPAPLAEKRPRWKGSFDEADFHKKNGAQEGRGGQIRSLCIFCSGGGKLGDGRAGLAAKLGRAVRLGHPHCLAVLLSRMTWGQRAAATEAPALLHPGGGPPEGGVGSSLPAVILGAQLGKPECLGLLLRRCKPDLDVTHGKKRLTALAWAAHKGYMRCCKLLIAHGANPATKCGDGMTALHLAASGGDHIAICKLLIGHHAPVNARSAKKQTPLCLAAQKGFVKVVQLLLEHGADPNNEDEGKFTPLHLSASNGFVSSVDLLLKAGAEVDATSKKGVTPLHYAVQGGHAAVVKLLISAGASVDCNRKPLLLIAADDGNLEVVQILLDANAQVDCKANVPAHLDKDTEFSDYLTPLHLASSRNHQEVVELLLRRGANVNVPTSKSQWSALDLAVLNGHAECAVILLQHGSLVTDNCKRVGRNNWTLVQHAASHGAKEVVRLLIQRLKEQRMNAMNGPQGTLSSGIGDPQDTDCSQPDAPGSALLNPTSEHTAESVSGSAVSCNHGSMKETDMQSSSSATEHSVCNHEHPPNELNDTPHSAYPTHDQKSSEGDEKKPASANSSKNGPVVQENGVKSGTSRRRVVKDDRQAVIRARELRKREQWANEARDRLEEAIAQRSVSKLSDAITHVSKLVFRLTTSGGTDGSTGGGHVDYNDANGYGVHGDSYNHAGHVHGNGSKHSAGSSSASALSSPLPMEVGLGNEVQKARKILAGLQAEEKRLREEKEREVADSRRDNAQQTVRKAIAAALEGGDPRSLSRATNRATRTILEGDDPAVIEALTVSSLISSLEKWVGAMKTAVNESSLSSLSEALPETEKSLSSLLESNGEGAAARVFGGTDPNVSLSEASNLLKLLREERETEMAKEAAARDLEKSAQKFLEDAISSNDFIRLESALDKANSALLSKDSDLASAIEAGKKLLTKWLKGERRKLRQASNTNDPKTIEEAAAVAEQYGLQALKADIDTAKARAQKLRDQAEAFAQLEEAIAKSDVSSLGEIKNKLNGLGMFTEAERAREEVERLQRATRARTLLEGAVKEANDRREPMEKALRESKSPSDSLDILTGWTWPDAQRLCDLADRARKYPSLQSLCNLADDLAKELAVLGRRLLSLLEKSDDATAIASIISNYEKAFVNVSHPDVFDRVASEKAVKEARRRLAEVQTMDQASVKAESAQVKVEYALATSRRSAARNRNIRTTSSRHAVVSDNTVSSPTFHRNLSGLGDMRSPSSFSSDLIDEEHSEADTSLSGILQGEGSSMIRAGDGHRPIVEKRARISSQPTDDSGSLDTLGDETAVFPGDCSHFYLFKEGTTVCCARCGHLRNSSNPEWLARVKRRGTKVPSDVTASVLPRTTSGSDLHTALQNTHAKLQGRSPSTTTAASHAIDRGIVRPGRTPVSGGLSHHGSQGFPHSVTASSRELPRVSSSHGMVSPAQAPGMSVMMQMLQQQHPSHQQKLPSNQVRGRNRPHGSQMPPPLSHHIPSMVGVYGSDLNASPMQTPVVPPVSLPTPGTFGTSAGIQGLPQVNTGQSTVRGYGMLGIGNSLPGLDPKSSMRVPSDIGVVPNVNQHGVPVDSLAGTHVGQRHVMSGPNNVGTLRAMPIDDMGGSGMDLGLDFANENFGFDIDAIVDDNPPPRPGKSVGGVDGESHAEVPKMFIPNRAQPSGFFRR